ncbi:NAD-dependent epimerase/dehydratase family protein [Calothrix membranacea FACHB-236]|nr:NAD-dependent epimerase/dehydratase family protein [Calothrix membranacea FACHB-236]
MLINLQKSKLVLLTGATGFLGSHLVRQLLREKYKVIILKRSFSNTTRIKDILSELIIYDIDKCDIKQPFQDFKQIDIVIHTATNYGRNNENIIDILEANTLFPIKLIETAIYFNTNIFINTDTILSKDINYYSLSKNHFLDWAKQLAEQNKIHVINLKIEHMFGEGDDSKNFVTNVIRSFLKNVEEFKLTKGEQKRDFIYIADVIAAYIVLLSHVQSHIKTTSSFFTEYEIGSGKSILIKEFVEIIHNLTQSKTRLCLGDLAYRKKEIMFSEARIQPLLQIGWYPKYSLEDALSKTIDYELKCLS